MLLLAGTAGFSSQHGTPGFWSRSIFLASALAVVILLLNLLASIASNDMKKMYKLKDRIEHDDPDLPRDQQDTHRPGGGEMP
ncbi:MAG: hypothetical protein WD114_00950 [Phycisphaerales bacterium]